MHEHTNTMSNFTFDFDLADDLDDEFDFAQEAPAEPVHTEKEVEDGYQPFAELSIAELVRKFDCLLSESTCTDTGAIFLKCSSHPFRKASRTHHSSSIPRPLPKTHKTRPHDL